jgi:hypothetical protein
LSDGARLPARLRAVLPRATQDAWRRIASIVPASAYLVSGTALAVHLGHRQSRDLDFFTTASFDPQVLAAELRTVGTFEPTRVTRGSLTGVLDGARIQFLDAHDQLVLEAPGNVAGLPIASLVDLLATKLTVVGDRGELRDYFDLMTIEEQTLYRVEQGIAFYVARYRPQPPEASVAHIVRGLGHFDDVADDPGLPIARAAVERYWRRRQPQIAASLAKDGG